MSDLAMTAPGSWDRSFRTLAPLAHCEGVATGPDGLLYAGDETGRLFRVDPDAGTHEQIAQIDGWALGLCLDADGLVYVCAFDRGAVVRVDPRSGRSEVYAEELGLPNWPLFAPDGTLFVSDSGSEEVGAETGRVLAIPPGGGDAEPLPIRPLAFANGMALDHDGTLFVAESFVRPGVVAVREGRVETWCELPGTVPDGLALDEEGGLVVTSYQPNQVLRIPPGGRSSAVLLDDWAGQRLLTPTNAAYFGPELRSLAISSLCGWSLSAIDTAWRGRPLYYPRVPKRG
jgi:sugar lactone lactonase YvrE